MLYLFRRRGTERKKGKKKKKRISHTSIVRDKKKTGSEKVLCDTCDWELGEKEKGYFYLFLGKERRSSFLLPLFSGRRG